MRRIEDLTGQRFGKLLVVSPAEPKQYKKSKAGRSYCLCDCGNYKIMMNMALKGGRAKSCGCGCKENQDRIMNHARPNVYDLSGEIGKGKATNADVWFYFDKEDYDKIKDYSWALSHRYMICNRYKNDKYIYLHKFIIDVTEDMVDHINGDGLDCRKSNLRVVTQHQNSMNHKIASNNTSGVSGVSWKKDKKRWKSYITYKGKQIHLGYFKEDEFELAVKARKKAEEKYFGEYARQ